MYGYKPIQKGSSDSIEIETDRENAASLAKALYTAIGIPMALCCLIYSFLYCTYPRDRDRAKMDTLIESEMQQILEADNVSLRKYSQVSVTEADEQSKKETSVIDRDYGREASNELDDNDEKSLLFHELTITNFGE